MPCAICHVLLTNLRLSPPILVHITNGVVGVQKNDKIKRRKLQALNLAGIYGAFLLATLVFRQQETLLGL
ncbi:MAG: hypothetical protein Q8S19_09885, partial [Bacillota bacterium]|nr:hypothetical protein [Bacillota bacterium]